MFPLDPSDVVLLLDFVLAVVVAGYFTFGGPLFAWTRDPLGWVIFSYSVVTVGLLFLIVWAIAFDQKVDEWARFTLAFLFACGLIGKGTAMYGERRKGRLARDQFLSPEGSTMNPNDKLTLTEIQDATTIWYKGKRVLRTAVATLISTLSAWAGFSAIYPDIAAQLGTILPGAWIVWLTGAVAAVTAVSAALTGIMAIPKVNAFLTKWLGLGTVPKSSLVVVSKTPDGTRELEVLPPENAEVRYDG